MNQALENEKARAREEWEVLYRSDMTTPQFLSKVVTSSFTAGEKAGYMKGYKEAMEEADEWLKRPPSK